MYTFVKKLEMKKIIYCIALVIITQSCGVAVPLVDYARISVPEEGSLRLTKYTEGSDHVAGPVVQSTTSANGVKSLQWYAAPLLAISPDDKKIVYLATNNGFTNMYLRNITGGKSTIQRTFNRNIMDMDFSPSGDKIVFTENKSSNNIYTINAYEGVAVQQMVATNATELSPSYSADGKNIYFAKSEGTRYYIWSLNVESSLLTQYTEGFTPCLTPDNENLIMTRNSKDGSRGEIWMVNLRRGTETLILSDPNKGYSSPQISPDGKRIICVGVSEKDETKPQNLDLFLVNLDGTKLTQLTFHGGNDVSPVWTKDGKSIFFISQRGSAEGKFNVWKMGTENL
jgi:Tol biopolymer transport system component